MWKRIGESHFNGSPIKVHVIAIGFATLALAGCEAVGLAGGGDAGDEWPGGSVEHVVPLPSGGGTDTVTQLLNQPLEEELGVSVTVQVRDGGAGATGINYMLDQDSDGHTLMTSPNDLVTTQPVGNPDVAYDPESDLRPVTMVTRDPYVMLASTESGFENPEDFLDAARSDPKSITVGISSVMSSDHYAWLLVERSLDYPGFNYVTYGGGGPYLQALYANEVDLVFHLESSIDEELMSPLLVADTESLSSYPDVATTDEVGLDDAHASLWQGIFIHPDTDDELVERIATRVASAIESEAFQDSARDGDLTTSTISGPELDEIINQERTSAEEIVSSLGEVEVDEDAEQ